MTLPTSILPCLPNANAVLELLGERRQPQFEGLAKATATMFGCPLGAITVVECDRQWFKAVTDPSITEIPTEQSICRHALVGTDLMVVEDLSKDLRFAANPLVTEEGMRFYAGRPIWVKIAPDSDAVPIGALCMIDFAPRSFSAEERDTLEQLGMVAQTLVQAAIDAAVAERSAEQLAELLADQQRAHRQLRQGEKIAGFGTWRLCLADNRVEWSDQVYAIHEVPKGQEEMLEDALSFYPPSDRAILSAAVEQAISTGRSYDLEVDFITAKGRSRRVRAMGEVELDQGKPVALIGVFQDVTERYRLEQALIRKANTDELTGIASRRRFNESFDAKTYAPRASGQDVALILIDLDRFKEANDRFGHAVGDELLVKTAKVLSAPWLKDSFAARLGGDEFVLLVTDTQLMDNLDGTIGRLLEELRLSPSIAPDFAVSGTIGAVRIDDPAMDRERATGLADRALYKAKDRKRGSAVLSQGARDVAIPQAQGAKAIDRAA